MTSDVKIEVNLEDLDKLKEKLSSDLVTKIGIFGGSARGESDGITNSEIALKHEFGSIEENIPPRSFLRMPLEHKGRDITKFLTGNKVKDLILKGDLEGVMKLLGVKAESIIQLAFDSGGFGKWPRNSAMTIKLKGGDRPLIHTSQLRRAVTSQVSKNG